MAVPFNIPTVQSSDYLTVDTFSQLSPLANTTLSPMNSRRDTNGVSGSQASPPNDHTPNIRSNPPETLPSQGQQGPFPISRNEPQRMRSGMMLLADDQESQPSEDDDEDDDDDDEDNEDDTDDEDDDDQPRHRWRPIAEDLSLPCEDELAFIQAKEEHSAEDHHHWEEKTFFDLQDPDLKVVDSGRLDWEVNPFNGTKEKPNTEMIMQSSSIKVGGYEWRMKLFPQGDKTEFISMYIECVTMHSPDFVASEEFEHPPLPFLSESDISTFKKRRGVAAQVSVIMYNPEEPRVYEFKSDAHQFHKDSSDYGWRYFSRSLRSEFHLREHGQRQAILRNDKLAFSAHIRVIDDPTGCMWEHGSTKTPYSESLATTGIRPFAHPWPQYAAALPLLHLSPFRSFLYECKKSTRQVHELQTLLLKMLKRECSSNYGQRINGPNSHAITYLQGISRRLRNECNPTQINALIGSFDPDQGAAVGSNRLKIKESASVQDAIDNHPSFLATPSILTLELERQQFDSKVRKWQKITHKISLNDDINVSGVAYSLFAFATHCGDLQSNKHHVYVRPAGPGHSWYAYRDGRVTVVTQKQAFSSSSGSATTKDSKSRRVDSMFNIAMQDPPTSKNEVPYTLTYVRADSTEQAFSMPRQEHWDIPDLIERHKTFPVDSKDETPEDLPYHEQEGLGTALTLETNGSHTPLWLSMDGEDVVMSDVEEISHQTENPEDHDTAESNGDAMAISILLTKPPSGPPSPQLWTTITDGIGIDYYSGQMMGDERHGDGHLIDLSGDEYRGQFEHGKPHGQGKMIYASNGNVYAGEWKDGKHHGTGSLTELDTKNVYVGGWKEGKKHGDFMMKGVVTEEDKGCCRICSEQDMNTAFYDCGHVVACKNCAAMIEICPVCRKQVMARLQIYGVKMTME